MTEGFQKPEKGRREEVGREEGSQGKRGGAVGASQLKLKNPLAEVTWEGRGGKFKGTKEREPGEGRAGVLEEVNDKGKAESVFGWPGRL